jgi:2-desacetyl-2-hydroxyethyl bacteriochlorophyllide A dehydrogenase
MQAIQFEKPHICKLVDVATPAPPAEGEVLVRVHNVGVCGTDISGFLGKMPFFSYPRIPGHELGVEVLARAKGATTVELGDRCSVEPYLNCQTCSACKRGHTNCCENNQTLGVHCDGGLRPYYILPARKLHVSRKLTYEQLALVETLAIGCHAINRANVQPNESLLVIGAGPIGLSVIEFAKLARANTIVMDVNPQRLQFCKTSMGISKTLVPKGDASDEETLKKLTHDASLPTIVVDATGSNKSMSNALNYCGFAGRVVYVGITQAELTLPHAPVMHRRELTLLASRNALPDDFTRIIKLIEDGKLDTRPWITHRSKFEDLPNVFASYTKPETGVIKAMVQIDEA